MMSPEAQAILSQMRAEVHLLNEGAGEEAELLAEITRRKKYEADLRALNSQMKQQIDVAIEVVQGVRGSRVRVVR